MADGNQTVGLTRADIVGASPHGFFGAVHIVQIPVIVHRNTVILRDAVNTVSDFHIGAIDQSVGKNSRDGIHPDAVPQFIYGTLRIIGQIDRVHRPISSRGQVHRLPLAKITCLFGYGRYLMAMIRILIGHIRNRYAIRHVGDVIGISPASKHVRPVVQSVGQILLIRHVKMLLQEIVIPIHRVPPIRVAECITRHIAVAKGLQSNVSQVLRQSQLRHAASVKSEISNKLNLIQYHLLQACTRHKGIGIHAGYAVHPNGRQLFTAIEGKVRHRFHAVGNRHVRKI